MSALLSEPEFCRYCSGQGRIEAWGDYTNCFGEYIGSESIQQECPACEGTCLFGFPPAEMILLAAWDPRNARIGCGHEHHPRFDSKQMPTLIVPRSALPDHVEEFAADWGLESELERKFS